MAAMYAMATMDAMRTAEKAGDWRMAMELLSSMCHFDKLKGLRIISESFPLKQCFFSTNPPKILK